MEQTFKKGEIIMREGEPGNEAFIINGGKVEVFKSKQGRRITLAVLGANQIFGEMSMIDDRPRSASVVALEDTTVTGFGPAEFNELLYSNTDLLHVFLKNLFERLRHIDQAVIDLAVGSSAENYAEGKVFLSGLTPEAEASLDKGTLELKRFPFKVGRRTENCEKNVFSHNDLYLDDKPPFNVSRNHFSIQGKMDRYLVIDRGSTLGTIVNDVRIGGPAGVAEAALEKGLDNTVTAGSPDSPYQFKVSLR